MSRARVDLIRKLRRTRAGNGRVNLSETLDKLSDAEVEHLGRMILDLEQQARDEGERETRERVLSGRVF